MRMRCNNREYYGPHWSLAAAHEGYAFADPSAREGPIQLCHCLVPRFTLYNGSSL